jgi:site-specific recombinase XerD
MLIQSPTSSGSLYSLAGQRKYLSCAERTAFIAAAIACKRPELMTFCLTLAYTGCRISEALSLRTASVNRREGFVAVVTLKKRGRWVVREVPLPVFLVERLADVHRLESAAADTPLWTWCRSRAWQLVKTVMAEARIDAGLHATPKGLRHGFGLHAVRSGVPVNLVQRWLGHARLETTSIYLQAIGPEEREIAGRMWK